MAGGRGIKTPFGIFYGSNITPHPEAGIGRWCDEDFVRAMTLGEAPDGSHYFPVFPYTSFRLMTETDLLHLKDTSSVFLPARKSTGNTRSHFLSI